MTQGRSCITACSALQATGLSAGSPVPLILLSFNTLSCLIATQVKKYVLLMAFREEEKKFQVFM